MRSLQEVFAYLFDIKDVLVSRLNKATNVIQVQLGDSTAEVPDSDAAAWWQHTGFASMAAAPTKGGASCQALVLKRGDRDIAFASRDTRGSAIYGQLKPGETCVYAPGAQCRILLKNDGSVTLYTAQGNAPGGASIAISVNSDGTVNIVSPLGAISLSISAIQLMFGSSSGVRCDSNGVTLIGQALGLNGGAVSLGANASQGVVLGPLLATQLAALSTWASAVGSAVSALAPPVTGLTTTLVAALGVPNASTSVKAAL